MDNYLIVIVIAVLVMIFVGGLSIGARSSDQAIVTDETFRVTGGTSEYTCVISEADNDLSLNCLEGAK